MSAVGGSDIPRPSSPHADRILGNLWPLESESAWGAFAEAILAEGWRLWGQLLSLQAEVLALVARQEAEFIEAILKLIYCRDALLDNRAKTYEMASKQAAGVGTAIWATKFKMAESVAGAESTITAAKNELEPKIAAAESAGQAAAAAALIGELNCRITAALIQGQDEVIGHAEAGAGEITRHEAKITDWPAPDATDTVGGSTAATQLSTGTNGAAAPASGGNGVAQAGYDTWKDSPTTDRPPENAAAPGGDAKDASNQTMSSVDRNPTKVQDAASTPNDNAATSPGISAAPPVASAPSPGGSSMGGMGGGPSSVLGSVMQPMQGMASPASSSPGAAGSPGGMPGVGAGSPGAAASAGSPSAGGVAAGAGGAAAGVGRGASAAGLGSGIAESSARMGTGAVSATANALGVAGNVGSQVAQGAAAAAAQAAPAATSGTPASSAAGGAPMAMVPPPATQQASPVVGGPVSGAAAAPGTPNVSPGVPGTVTSGPVSSTGASAAAGGAGAGPVPAMLPMTQMRSVSAAGHTGDVLVDQAADAARSIVETLLAQTCREGVFLPLDCAVSLIWERTGEVSAWLATGDGPSYIPMGVRLPDNVHLAVVDRVVGRGLWDQCWEAGAVNPLEVLVSHARMRDAAALGARVLALASSRPEGQVTDWAREVGARPIGVDARLIDGASANGAGHHRCEEAMPWEWRQANAFREEDRLRVAARHMHMARIDGHLTSKACMRVIDLFERRKPISDSDWADVREEWVSAMLDYDQTKDRIGLGGATPPTWAFKTARAAEVVMCLRNYATTEGCADLLYATRLAGAPLHPDAAVA
jgi:hypothetical protein